MAWDKVSPYAAKQGDWTLARYIVAGADRFLLWFGGGEATRKAGAKRIPLLFEDAKAAVAFAKWVEDNARDVMETLAVKKPLTEEQMEVI